MHEHKISANFVLWSTGIAMNPFTSRVSSLLPNQFHKKAIEVDAHLRVKGSPLGDVYAIGDCATVQNNVSDHIVNFLRTTAWEKGKNKGRPSFSGRSTKKNKAFFLKRLRK